MIYSPRSKNMNYLLTWHWRYACRQFCAKIEFRNGKHIANARNVI